MGKTVAQKHPHLSLNFPRPRPPDRLQPGICVALVISGAMMCGWRATRPDDLDDHTSSRNQFVYRIFTSMSDAEIPLQGGRTTAAVVRVGQTVRRPPRLTAEFVHVLLEHLAAVGFDGAPRFLGTDDKGRDILSYIEGEVPADLRWHKDEVLVAAAQLIRKFHDATVGLLGHQTGTPRRLEVVCHNDLSPCNSVFRDGFPVALIDFDTAAPGTRLMDLGYAAWLWLDLGDPDIAPASASQEQRRRLQLFIAAYGDEISVSSIKEAIVYRQHLVAAEGEYTARTAMARWARHCRNWTVENL